MWIVTNKGFLSVVSDRNNKGSYVIRARNKEAFDGFFGEREIVEMSDSDYRFRVFTNRSVYDDFIDFISDKIDYDNFKNSIKNHEVKSMASSIWTVSYNFQTKRYGNQEQSEWYKNYRTGAERYSQRYSDLFDDELEDEDEFNQDVSDAVFGEEEMGQFEEKFGISLDDYLNGSDFNNVDNGEIQDENDYEYRQGY